MKSKVSIKKLLAAQRKGLVYFRKHYPVPSPCDFCGKANPVHLIIIFENEKEKTEVLENPDDPIYLNCFQYIVGSTCLSKIKKLIGNGG